MRSPVAKLLLNICCGISVSVFLYTGRVARVKHWCVPFLNARVPAQAMSGPRTLPIQHGPPMHQAERGPKSVRQVDVPATTDIMRSKSDLHLYVREAQELSRPPRPSLDLPSATADSGAVIPDDSSNPRSRHRFRLPTSIGRVFGAKRDMRRSSSVTALGHSATSPLAQNAPAY